MSRLSRSGNNLLRLVLTCLLLVTGFISMASPAYAASNYGEGVYSGCSYQQACPPPAPEDSAPPTVIETPAGLEVAINLNDGQKIPRSGYEIRITPLNGRGSSFQKAEIYIDDVLAHSDVPTSTGDVKWQWLPSQYPGKTVKIIVYSTDGTTTTKSFTVEVVDDDQVVTTPTPGAAGPTVSPQDDNLISNVQRAIERGSEKAQQFIRTLPAPIVYGFPYILFILLGIGMLLILLQEKRELSEARTMRYFAERQRNIISAKESFVQLSSHYLRTPLAIIDGGISLLTIKDASKAPQAAALQAALLKVKQPIETLLASASVSEATVPTVGVARPRIWTRLIFWLPLVVIGSLSVVFSNLARKSGALNTNLVNSLVQIIIFCLLALLLYQLIRRLQLYRADRSTATALSDEELRLSDAQDQFVGATVGQLQAGAQDLEKLVAALPLTAETKAIHDGYNRLMTVLYKMIVASQLRNTKSTDPFQTSMLSQLVAEATFASPMLVDNKNRIQIDGDVSLSVQQPKLFTLVLKSLLDNAVAYSPADKKIDIAAEVEGGDIAITVHDDGQGIPAEKLNTLFRPFERAEDATHFDREGMGFSLYLDRLIMTYLGGSIDAVSNPGNGTTIALKLPKIQSLNGAQKA